MLMAKRTQHPTAGSMSLWTWTKGPPAPPRPAWAMEEKPAQRWALFPRLLHPLLIFGASLCLTLCVVLQPYSGEEYRLPIGIVTIEV